MKTLQEYILINEAWGNFKNYKRELEDLLDKYNKKEESNKDLGKDTWSFIANKIKSMILTVSGVKAAGVKGMKLKGKIINE